MLKAEGGYITYPPMSSYEPHPKAVETFQAACLAEFKIRLPQKAAYEFCRLSNELEFLDSLSNSGTNPPIDAREFHDLWQKLTGEDLSEANALDYGRRSVIITKYKRQQELRAQLRIILIKHKHIGIAKEHVHQFQTLIYKGFSRKISYAEARRLLPTFVRNAWFDEGMNTPIGSVLDELTRYHDRKVRNKKISHLKHRYIGTREFLEGLWPRLLPGDNKNHD